MTTAWSRRTILKGLAAASTAIIAPPAREAGANQVHASTKAIEIQLTSLSPHTFRLTVLSASKTEETAAIPSDGSLVQTFRDGHVEKFRADPQKNNRFREFQTQDLVLSSPNRRYESARRSHSGTHLG